MLKKEERGFCECVFERVTHALSIKRIEGDQVARQLRATIVPPDNSSPESALSSLSLCFFCFLSPSLSHTHYMYIWSAPQQPTPTPLLTGLDGNKELTVSRSTEKESRFRRMRW